MLHIACATHSTERVLHSTRVYSSRCSATAVLSLYCTPCTCRVDPSAVLRVSGQTIYSGTTQYIRCVLRWARVRVNRGCGGDAGASGRRCKHVVCLRGHSIVDGHVRSCAARHFVISNNIHLVGGWFDRCLVHCFLARVCLLDCVHVC